MSHTPGPWRLECFESGTVYVHMRHASCKDGPRIIGPDHSDQDGHVGAHLHLYNVPAFKALTGETEADLEVERMSNGKLIVAAPDMLDALLAVRAGMRGKPAPEGLDAVHWQSLYTQVTNAITLASKGREGR